MNLIQRLSHKLMKDLVRDSLSECVIIEQCGVRTDKIKKLTFSMAQLKDQSAAINLPEVVYTRFHIKNLNDNIRSSDRNCF